MTVSDDVLVRTSSDLLYVSVDLGVNPDLSEFSRNARGLEALGRFALDMNFARGGAPGANFPIVRTSLASPWVTVLGDLARASSPIGYGIAGLYGLHRLLNVVMTWQQHRLDIAERTLRLQALSAQLEAEGLRQLEEAKARASSEEMEQSNLEQQIGMAEKHFERASRQGGPLLAAYSADGLGDIQAAEMISPDDPRSGPPNVG